jgi:hypothetical protein
VWSAAVAAVGEIVVVIGMQHCSPREGFDMLRSVSQNRNIPLREVAAELVVKVSEPPAPPGAQ